MGKIEEPQKKPGAKHRNYYKKECNMNDKKTQCKLILDYLEAHGSITAWEAMEQLHIMRLASRVHDLRKLGCNIVGKMVTNGNGKRFKVYRMEVAA